MADVFSPEKRSEVMSRIRGGGTKPELVVRAMLHHMGYRFTVSGPWRPGAIDGTETGERFKRPAAMVH
jgi:DNA mismatch endonuclease (patch repair protein)